MPICPVLKAAYILVINVGQISDMTGIADEREHLKEAGSVQSGCPVGVFFASPRSAGAHACCATVLSDFPLIA